MVQKIRKPPPTEQPGAIAPKRRGRPRAYQPEIALGKALDLFRKDGFAATSLDDLAAATGLNRPSLYGAFGDKHALYIAALQRSRDESVRALGESLSLYQSLREVMRIIYSTAIRVYRAGDAGQRGCFLIGTAVTQAVDDP